MNILFTEMIISAHEGPQIVDIFSGSEHLN